MLTGLPSFCAGVYLLSFLSGFPSGVIAAAQLYKSSAVTKEDAERLAAVSNNTGPALPVFLIGGVFFGDTSCGLAVYFIQILSSLICAFVFRKHTRERYEPVYPEMRSSALRAVTDSVEGSIRSCAVLCAYVILFSCVSDALSLLPLNNILAYIKPFIEIVSGSRAASGVGTAYSFIAVCSALSFGGLCVHMQAASVCASHKLSVSLHLKLKLTQALIAAVSAAVYMLCKALCT